MNDIIVVILAGGDSTRFWPLREKLFTEFAGHPLLYYRLKQLEKYNLKKIVIIGTEANKAMFAKFTVNYPEFSYEFIQQTDKRGMAGAVLSAKEYIGGKSVLIIKPVDIIEDTLFEQLKACIQKKEEIHGILTGIKVSSYFSGGYLSVKEGLLTDIIEKPGEKNTPSDVVRIVFDYFPDASVFMEYIDKAQTHKDDVYEVALNMMAKDGKKLKVLNYNDYWGYLTYSWHVLSVMSFFLEKVKSKKGVNVQVAKNATIIGDVILEDGVRVLENAKIVGPSYIGRNTVVGNNSVIRESMIGANCVVGYSTEITRSYVAGNCWFHTNYVGDSVVADNVGLGGRATVANFRLDEKSIYSKVGKEKIDTGKTKFGTVIGQDVRIGVGTLIMPGIKVGKGSFVGSGVILSEDLEDDKAIFVRQSYTVKNNKEKMEKKSRESLRKSLKI